MKLRLPARLLAALAAAASHVAFLTVASASGAWAVENASVDLTFVDSADAPAIVADGESLAELPSAQSAEEAVATLADAEAEKVTAADAALPEEIAAAGDSVVVTAPMTAEEVAAVSAAPEVKTVGGANTTENVTGAKLLAEEAALVAAYNAIMPGAEGTETPAVSYPANNAAATQTAAANLTVPETAVASDNTTTLNLSAASAAPQTQTAALTTETVSGSTGSASVSSPVASSVSAGSVATGSSSSSGRRSAPVFLATGADVSAPAVFLTTGVPASVSYADKAISATGTYTDTPTENTWYKHDDTSGDVTYNINGGSYDIKLSTQQKENQNLGSITANSLVLSSVDGYSRFKIVGGTSLNLTDGLSLDGAQLWVMSDWVYNGDISLKNSAFTADREPLTNAAMRINANLTLGGDVALAGDTKITWQDAGKTVNMTGALSGRSALELAVYSGGGTFNLTGDASGFTGGITTAAGITANLTKQNYTFASLTPNGTLNLAVGTAVTLTNNLTADSLLRLLRNTVGNATVISKIGGEIELSMGGVSSTIRANHTISGPNSRQVIRLNSYNGGATTTTIQSGRTLHLTHNALLRVETNSTLKVCGALTIDNDTVQLGHWNAGAHPGHLLIEGGDVSIKNFELLGGSTDSSAHSSVVMNSGTLKLTGAGNAFSNVGEAASRTTYVDVSLNGGVIKTEGNSWTLNRNATIGGIEVQTGTGRITLGNSDTTMLLRGTITNEGNLGLAGTATVDLTDMTAFKLYNGRGSANKYSGKGDYSGSGFLIEDTAQYYLVKGGENSSLTGAFSTLNGADVVENAETGSVVISAAADNGIYYVNNGNLSYGDTMDDATKIAVAEGATLSIGGADAASLLNTKVVGVGTVAITENTTINTNVSSSAPYTSLAAGTLLVKEGKSLTLGTDKENHYLDFSSFSAVKLENGASIHVCQRPGVTLNNLSVASGASATIKGDDTYNKDVDAVVLAGTTTINGTLSLNAGRKYQMTIDKVTGSGTLVADATDETHRVIINGTEGTFGTVQWKNNNTEVVIAGDSKIANLTNVSGTGNSLVIRSGATLTLSGEVNKLLSLSNSGTLAIAEGQNVKFYEANNLNLGHVALGQGSTLSLRSDSGARTYNISRLEVGANGGVSVLDSDTRGEGHHSVVNIDILENAAGTQSGVAVFGNAARSSTSIFNFNGGSFTGEMVLKGEAYNGTRRTAYQLKDADVAAGSVLTFDAKSGNDANNKLGLGIAENVSVQGIRHQVGVNVNATIYSGAVALGHNADFDSQGTDIHTVTLTGDGQYATSAVVKNHLNLVMDSAAGTGVQTFSGNLSAFDGSITVNSGTLVLSGTGLGASGAARTGAVSLGGGTLDLSAYTTKVYTGALMLGSPVMALAEGDAAVATLKLGSGGLNANSLVLNAGILDLTSLGVDGVTDSYILATAEDALSLGSSVDFTLGADASALKSMYSLGTEGHNLVLTLNVDKYIWDGTEANHTWSATSTTWRKGATSGQVLPDGAYAEFTVDAANRTVLIVSDVTAGNLKVKDAAYVFDMKADDARLTATAITVSGDGASLALDGASKVTNSGSYSVGTGASLILRGGDVEKAVSLENGAHLVLGEGANITHKPTISNGSAILDVEAGVSATWNSAAQIGTDGSRHGFSQVNIGENATLKIDGGDGQWNVFQRTSANGSLKMNVGEKATLWVSNTSLQGWNGGNSCDHVINLAKDSVYKLDASETYMNNTIINMSGATMEIVRGKLMFERNRNNKIATTAAAKQMSRIIGASNIQVGNNAAGTTVSFYDGDRSGYEFNVMHGAFDYDDENTADLQISAVFINHGSATGTCKLLKTGNGVMELVSDNSGYTDDFYVYEGTVKQSGAGKIGGGTLDLNTGTKLQLNNDRAVTLSNLIKGKGSVEMTGSSTVTLSGNNTYDGGTLVSAGTLVAANASALGSGAVTLSGGTLDLNSGTPFSFSSVEMSGGTLKLAGADMLTSTGSITLSSGTLDLSRLTMDDATQQYTLATGSSITLDNSVSFTLADGYNKDDYTLTSDGTHLLLTFQEKTCNLVWAGGERLWDNDAAHHEWLTSPGSTDLVGYKDGANVTFLSKEFEETPDTALLGQDVYAKTMTVQESGNVTIRNANTDVPYTLTVDDMVVNGYLHTEAAMKVNNSLAIGEYGLVHISAIEDFELDTPVSGNGMLVKDGAATVTVSGNNGGFSGDVDVYEGTLVVGNENALGTGEVTVEAESTLQLKQDLTLNLGTLWVEDGGRLSFGTGSSLQVTNDMFMADNSIVNLRDYVILPGSGDSYEDITLATVGGVLEATGDNIILTLPTGYHGRLVNDGSTLTVTDIERVDLYYWKGGPGVWSDVSWYLGQDGSELKNQADGADVVFDKRTASSAVTVVDQANTGTMTVTEDTRVVLMGKEDGSKLKADQLYVLGSLETRLDVDAKLVDLHGENSSWTVVTDAGIDRTFAGIIDCRGTLVKDGAGELTLTGDNSGFSGKTLIKAGTLHADSTNGHALGYAPRVEMSDGTELSGTLKVTHTNSYISSVDASGSACVSANMELAKNAVLTFNGDGNLVVSGEISGSGAVVKDGSGTLTLDHANTMTGTLEIQDGKVQVAKAAALGRADVMVDSGAVLALSSVSGGVQMGGSLDVGVSGVLAVGGNENLHVAGNLTLGTYAVLDLSNVALDPTTKRAVIATVDGTVSHYEGARAWEGDRLKYVALQNLKGGSGAAAGVLTAHLYFNDASDQLYVAMEEVGTGMYWVGSKEVGSKTVNYSGAWTGANWNSANNTTGVGGYDHDDGNSAYFMNNATATVNVVGHSLGKGTGVLVNQLIVGAGNYTFTGDCIYVGLDGSGLSEPGVVVREGASATFNKIEFSDNSNILVERNASLIIKEPQEAVLKDVNNYGNFSMTIANGQFHLTRLYNAAGATMQLLSPAGLIDNEDIPEDGVNFISVVNDGTLIIDQGHVLSLATEAAGGVATDIMNTGTLEFRADNAKVMDYFSELGRKERFLQGIIVSVPVRGEGKVITSGDHFVYFDSGFYAEKKLDGTIVFRPERLATVEAGTLTLEAALSRFDAQVAVNDATTLAEGKTAQFFAEGELAAVTMGAGSTLQLQGGMVSKGEEHMTGGVYVMDSLLSTGTGQTVEVTKGAMAHSRGSTGLADGHLVVGAEDDTVASTYVSDDNAGIYLLDMYANAVVTLNGDTNSIGTANVTSGSLTTKGTAEIDTLNQGSGSTTLNGESLVTQLNQTAGSVNINEDSTLVNGNVAGGIMALADGKELTVKNVIHAAGAYTLAATTGTINADALTLTVAGGYENTAKVITADQSGFLNAGDESVRVFDNGSDGDAALTLGDGVHTVTHSSASGELVLGADGVAVRRGDGTNYLAYYVRDNYVTGLAEGRTEAGDSGRTPASNMTADSVKLTDIYTAAEIGGAVLERVVFDKTDYNSTKTGLYHGMLTVDTDTAVQLFRVAADTQAALNVEEGKVLSADAAYTGVQGALDLQGQGVYELQNRNNLGANVALRDDTQKAGEEWNGTVRLTGTSDDVNLTGMSVGTGNDASTIEFKHWSGSLASGPLATDGRILLTGTNVAESAAMTLTGGSGVDYTFNNTVSGENAIVQHNGGDGVKLTFNASTAGWTGQYVQNTDTTDTLKFLGGTEANAGVAVSAGVADVTYGGTLQTVNSAATVYGGGELDLHYVNGTVESPLVVSSVLYSDALSTLTLTVGDGSEAAVTKFTGVFVGTENATMHVEDNSAATLATNAALLRVVGDAGSMVTVNEGETLTLTSTEAETYSEFHGLTNDGTIAMKADGGDIRLVADADETTFDAGKVVLSGAAGTATIETAVAAEQTATVNVTDLHGPAADTQVLALENQNGTGTVNYNLGGDTEVQGTIRFGTDSEVAEATGTTNVVLNSDTVAADAVLESAGAGKANVVVNTADARVLGLSSVEEGGNGKVYGKGGTGNQTLTITGDDTYSYNGALGENLDIAYTGSGKQTIAGGATDFNGAVNVNNSDTETGILQMMNATTVKITDLAIGANDKLGISSTTQTEHADEYGTAVVAKVMTTAEGAAMNANMRLEDSAVVSLGADGTLGNDALTMGMGNVSLGHNMTLAGDAINNALATVQEAWDATEGGLGSGNFDLTKHNYRVVLFDEVGSLTLGGQTFTEAVVNTDYIFARDYFSNLGALADYYVITFTQQGSAGFEVALEVIPEPTTSTLSLLALAALCARRRRK